MRPVRLAVAVLKKNTWTIQTDIVKLLPGTEVAIHLLSLTMGLFKKANKGVRSPSFKVG